MISIINEDGISNNTKNFNGAGENITADNL